MKRVVNGAVSRIIAAAAKRGVVLLGVALAGGCASTELDPASVSEARRQLEARAETARLYEFAGSSMRQAEQHLRRAEQILEQGGSQQSLDHHEFMARQQLAIAESRLRRGLTQEQIVSTEQDLLALVQQAERQEAEATARRVEEVEGELSETQMKLRMAEQRAKAMAKRLVEAGITDSVKPD